MYQLNAEEAGPRLEELIGEASSGENVVITTRNGTAVRLVPVGATGVPRFGSARGLFTMADDFDDPLEDFAPYER